MSATTEELGWAREIKAAALAKGLEAVSDFEYLQHAIVSKGKTGKALKRLERVAAFRKEYKLTSAEKDDAHALLVAVSKLFRGLMPGIGRDSDGHAVEMMVYRNFYPSQLRGEKEWRDMMGAFYYLFNAFNAEVADIRAGMVLICDCSGMGWNNFSLEVEKRCAAFYQDAYPVRMKHCYMIDAPIIVSDDCRCGGYAFAVEGCLTISNFVFTCSCFSDLVHS